MYRERIICEMINFENLILGRHFCKCIFLSRMFKEMIFFGTLIKRNFLVEVNLRSVNSKLKEDRRKYFDNRVNKKQFS